jgi:hypothetical protein
MVDFMNDSTCINRFYTWVLIAGLISSSLGTASCSRPESASGEVRTFISGQVIREANDQPIPGATIQTEPPTEQVLTNQAGNFSIEAEIEVGKVYRIKANKDGFVPNNTVVEAQEGKTTSADIVLKKQGPKLAAEPTSLTFGMRRSGDSVLIKNIGAETLRYQAQEPPVDWVFLAGQKEGTVTESASTLEVKVNRTGLRPGTYTTTIPVTSNGGEVAIGVTLEIVGENEPKLLVEPSDLHFAPEDKKKSFDIQNIGTGVLRWTISTETPWLSVNTKQGDTTDEVDRVEVTVSRKQVGVGTHNGELTIETNDETHTLSVTMESESEQSEDYCDPSDPNACEQGETCDPNTRLCKPGCDTKADCSGSKICNTDTHLCECPDQQHLCDGTCVSSRSTDHCGQRCDPCPEPKNGSASCNGRTCGINCSPGFRMCQGSCSECPKNATSTKCDGGVCKAAECSDGYRNCNGECKPCPSGASSTTCQSGQCVATACKQSNMKVCDGECSTCPPNTVTTTCSGNQCIPQTCASEYRRCGNACLKCPTDKANVKNFTCSSGQCVIGQCDSGFHFCNGSCVSNTSVDHCGTNCSPCATDSNGTAVCSNGKCGIDCNDGFKLCGGACTDCPDSEGILATTCSGGACKAKTCKEGFYKCNGTCLADGTEEQACDGIDNDCDGKVDENITKDCSKQQGVCQGATITCENGSFGTCDSNQYGSSYEANESSCDKLDNDCDGIPDEWNAGCIEAVTLATPENDQAEAIIEDDNNELYIAGWSRGDLSGQTNQGSRDAFVVEYDQNYAKNWIKLFGDSNREWATGIGVGYKDALIVQGAWSTNTFSRFPASGNRNEINTVSGRGLSDSLFVTTGGSIYIATEPNGVAKLDKSGNRVRSAAPVQYVSGIDRYNGFTYVVDTEGFLTKLEANNLGSFDKVWSSGLSGPSSARDSTRLWGIANGNSGDIYVVGDSKGNVANFTGKGSSDAYVAKFAKNGKREWIQQLATPNRDIPNDLAIKNGNVYVVGRTGGNLGSQSTQQNEIGFIAKFDSQGKKKWIELVENTDSIEGIVATENRDLHIVGRTTHDLDGNQHQGGYDAFVAW